MTRGEKKSIWASVLFWGGWTLVGFISMIMDDYLKWLDYRIMMLIWLLTLFLYVRFVYREGVNMKGEEEEKKNNVGGGRDGLLDKKEKFPIWSLIGVIHAVIGTVWIFFLSHDIVDSLGYGTSQLAYALFVAAIFSGTFRIFNIHKRLHTFGLSIALFIVGVVFTNM